MTWRHALGYAVVGILLAAVCIATAPAARQPLPPPPRAETGDVETAVDGIRIDAGDRLVRAVRSGGEWEIAEPAHGAVPADLIAALISAVLETRAEPVTADPARAAEFGLDRPTARITFDRTGAPPVTVALGSVNATGTGIYGRLEGNPQVVLLGLNVSYYVDLILKQVGDDNSPGHPDVDVTADS
jgi:hypothetical protein